MSAGQAGTSATTAVEIPEPKNEKEIVRRFQNMITRQRQMIAKLAELDAQRLEYSRVSTTLKPMDGGRRCYQLINNVLVERTLSEVGPIVDANLEGLEKVVVTINQDLTTLSREIMDYQTKYNIRMVNKAEAGGAAESAAQGQGVLA